jgi:N-terminal acetyltransferase B complex catalytic subunit
MTTLRRFTCDDLFGYNNVNLDILTETYHLPFYLTYLARCAEARMGQISLHEHGAHA